MLESFFQKRSKDSRQDIKQHDVLTKKKKLNDGNTNNPSKKEKAISDRINQDLKGSKFRVLNEYLYTNESGKAVNFFQENQEMFDQYHEGFRAQMKQWSSNPLDVIRKELETNPVYNNSVICDLGCGDGKLYEYFAKKGKIQETEVEGEGNHFRAFRSFDLVSKKDHIEACDIAHLPLQNGYANVCVFSLALMNRNYIDFIYEANRILQQDGYLIIAEVLSRMPNTALFAKLIKALGFKFIKYIKKNTYFIVLIFKKIGPATRKKTDKINFSINKEDLKKLSLKKDELITLDKYAKGVLLPCIYKKR